VALDRDNALANSISGTSVLIDPTRCRDFVARPHSSISHSRALQAIACFLKPSTTTRSVRDLAGKGFIGIWRADIEKRAAILPRETFTTTPSTANHEGFSG